MALLLWTALAGLIFGLIELGELPEDYLRIARNSFHGHRASGDIVVVTIDEPALRDVGNWPWPRRYDAQMVDRLTEAGAKRIFFDINFTFPTNAADDGAFARSIQRSGQCVAIRRDARQGRYGSSEPVLDRPPARARQECRSSRSVASATITRMRPGTFPTPP